MQILHVHLKVPDPDQAIGFYTTLFDHEPTRIEANHAKWQLDDSSLNFAVSMASSPEFVGLDHLGLQATDKAEFDEISRRLAATDEAIEEEGAMHCCYHVSGKASVTDPAGVV